jgi:hypothetical protein
VELGYAYCLIDCCGPLIVCPSWCSALAWWLLVRSWTPLIVDYSPVHTHASIPFATSPTVPFIHTRTVLRRSTSWPRLRQLEETTRLQVRKEQVQCSAYTMPVQSGMRSSPRTSHCHCRANAQPRLESGKSPSTYWELYVCVC